MGIDLEHWSWLGQAGLAPHLPHALVDEHDPPVRVAGRDPVVQAVEHRVQEPALLVDLVPFADPQFLADETYGVVDG